MKEKREDAIKEELDFHWWKEKMFGGVSPWRQEANNQTYTKTGAGLLVAKHIKRAIHPLTLLIDPLFF